ncbi:MAG: NADH-quinone oxidoreductase subunit B family protein [Nocardioidaceae bacterium]
MSDTSHDDAPRLADEVGHSVRRLFGRSLHIRTIDTGSCAACESEIRLLLAPHYDLHRLGLFFTPAPRHADLLMVTGPALRAMDQAVAKTYAAMPDPKLVIAVGGCALGGVYPHDAFMHGAVDQILPVDVYVPGCPPSPIALLQGLLVAVGKLAEKVPTLSFTVATAEPQEVSRR